MNDDDDLLVRADQLEERIADHAPAVDDLLAYSRKSRRLTAIALALSVVVSLLGAGLTLVVLRVRDTSRQLARADDVAAALAANLLERCEASNASKAGEAGLWQLILTAPPAVPRTPQQEKQVAAITATVAVLYAPTDCAALIAKP